MRHLKSGLKLSRTPSHRKAMFRNMVTSLLEYGYIKTTDVKAKEVGRLTEKIVTLAKKGDLHARRRALAFVRDKRVIHKFFEEALTLYGSRNGGYTRITKIGYRPGDSAPMSLVELIDVEKKIKGKGKESDKKSSKSKKEE
ncbi:MAG: 50S ribosomal protein L17 [Pseudomonadota bacterium]